MFLPPFRIAPEDQLSVLSGSAVAFQRIADAHHVLLDPEKRKAFDEGKAPQGSLGSQHPTTHFGSLPKGFFCLG